MNIQWQDQIKFIYLFSKKVMKAKSVEQVWELLAKLLYKNFGLYSVEIYEADMKRKRAVIKAKAGRFQKKIPKNYEQPFNVGIIGWCFRNKKSYLCNNIEEDEIYYRYYEACKSELCVPIFLKNKIIAAINLQSNRINAFTKDDQLLMEAVANYISVILNIFHLSRTLEGRLKELKTLYDLTSLLISTIKLEELMNKILSYMKDKFNYRHTAILLLDKEKKYLYPIAAIGYPNHIKEYKIPIGRGITGLTAKEGKVKYIEDVHKFNNYIEGAPEIVSEIAVPLKVGDQLIGVLDVASSQATFTKSDINFLSTIASELAIAIENANLYKELENSHRELSRTFFSTVQALSAAIEAKDPYTQGHVYRTFELAIKTAMKFNLSPNEIESIKYASLLHDIGKIGIPDAILLKPAKLTEEEWEIVKKHPIIGANIVQQVEFLRKSAEIILYHQERYDGRTQGAFAGYPYGLKGEDIPIGARIIAVVDSFDAMVSKRPYRDALSIEKAINTLLEEKGKQFDPLVVNAFLEVLKESDILKE